MNVKNYRISIHDLVAVARILGEFRVVAAGSLYATLALTEKQAELLYKTTIYICID